MSNTHTTPDLFRTPKGLAIFLVVMAGMACVGFAFAAWMGGAP